MVFPPGWKGFALCCNPSPNKSLGDYARSGAYASAVLIAERKYDGVRAGAFLDASGGVVIFGRRGEDLTGAFPELVEDLGKLLVPGEVADGEIVTEDAYFGGDDFYAVLSRSRTRDGLKARLLSKVNPCVFVCFGFVRGDRIGERTAHQSPMTKRVMYPVQSISLNKMWDDAEENGWEGIVVKACSHSSRFGFGYVPGRSGNWIKFKRFKEVRHVFREFEDTPKGVVLRDGERAVNINGADADEVKRLIQKDGSVCVEVQFMSQKDGDAWRFPSFRGVVRDVEVS